MFDPSWDIVEWAREESWYQVEQWRLPGSNSEYDESESSQSDDETTYFSCEDPDDILQYAHGYSKVTWETPALELMVASASSRRKARTQKPEGDMESMTSLERNAAKPRDVERIVPKGCIVEALVNGKPIRVLIDTGSFSDFISTFN